MAEYVLKKPDFGDIFSEKILPEISAVGLFSCDKFEETPKQKVIDLSKFKKITLDHFNHL